MPLLLAPALSAVIAGMVLIGKGTFFAQAVATGYVSRVSGRNRGAASGFYLASYFSGGLAGAAVVGQLFDRFCWTVCVVTIGIALVLAAVPTSRLKA